MSKNEAFVVATPTTPNMAAGNYIDAQDKLRIAQRDLYEARFELVRSLVKYERFDLLKVDDGAVRRAMHRGDF